MKFILSCTSWNDVEWNGKVYPTKRDDYKMEQLPTIEINTLEELMDFIAQKKTPEDTGNIVIMTSLMKDEDYKSDYPIIEVYDSWRE